MNNPETSTAMPIDYGSATSQRGGAEQASQNREVIAFAGHWKNLTGHNPALLIFDSKLTTQAVLAELDDRGIGLTIGRAREQNPAHQSARRPRRDPVGLPPPDPPARRRLPGYATATPDALQRRFLNTGGIITSHGDQITVRLNRRTYSPVLRQASLRSTITVPWWGGAPSATSTHEPDWRAIASARSRRASGDISGSGVVMRPGVGTPNRRGGRGR